MLTIQPLPTYCLTGNPVMVVLTTDNLFTYGAKAELILRIDAILTATGRKLTLSWGSISIEFTTAAVPDSSGLQLPAAASGMTVEAWTAALAGHFNYNYDLANDFVISHYTQGGNWYIKFTAREYGSAFQLLYSSTDFTGFITNYASITGIDRTRRDGFKILLQVLDKDGDIIGEDMATPGNDGKALFDISDYLKSLFQDSLIFPEPEDRYSLIESIKRFSLRYCEYYNGAFQKLVLTTSVNYCLPGGISFEYEGFLQEAGTTYFQVAENLKRFLSWAPATKPVSLDSPERASFLFAGGTANLVINVIFTDGTSGQLIETIESTDPAILEIYCGPANLAGSFPGKTISKISYILDQAGTLSEVRSLKVESQVYEYQRHFLFKNSFGQYEYIRFTGKGTSRNEYEREKGVIYPQYPRELLTPSMVESSVTESRIQTANSGWISEDMKTFFSDFLLSRQKLELIDGKLYPVILNTNKFLTRDDTEDLVSLDIEYIRASKNIQVSVIPSATGGSGGGGGGGGGGTTFLYILDDGFWHPDRVWGADMIWNP